MLGTHRVSNMKYEVVLIDSFQNSGFHKSQPTDKKETTDRLGSHVNFIPKQCTVPEVVSPENVT